MTYNQHIYVIDSDEEQEKMTYNQRLKIRKYETFH